MKNLFVPYEIALLAKKNGFNEPSFGVFVEQTWGNGDIRFLLEGEVMDDNEEILFPAPLYQQLIDWFRIEHDILIWVETATYVNMFNYRYYIETYDNKAEGMKTNNYYKALNDAIKKAFKMIPQISE